MKNKVTTGPEFGPESPGLAKFGRFSTGGAGEIDAKVEIRGLLIRLPVLFALFFLLASCAGEATRISLRPETLDNPPFLGGEFPFQKKFRLVVDKVEDLRPSLQVKGGRQWQKEGWGSWLEARFLGSDKTGYQINLQALSSEKLREKTRAMIIDQLRQSDSFLSVTKSGRRDFRLEVKILDYYGHSFLQTSDKGRASDADRVDREPAEHRRQFLPYGLATLHLALYETDHNRLVWKRDLQGVHLPYRKDGQALFYRDAFGQKRFRAEKFPQALSNAAVKALKKAVQKIPLALQPIIKDYYKEKKEKLPTPFQERFYLCRLTKRGKYLERTLVEVKRGRVIKSIVVPAPPLLFSRPGEWVLDPYQGKKSLLPPSQYRRLASYLEKRGFELARLTDVYIYHFMGLK